MPALDAVRVLFIKFRASKRCDLLAVPHKSVPSDLKWNGDQSAMVSPLETVGQAAAFGLGPALIDSDKPGPKHVWPKYKCLGCQKTPDSPSGDSVPETSPAKFFGVRGLAGSSESDAWAAYHLWVITNGAKCASGWRMR